MLTFTGGEGLADRMKSMNFLPLIESEVIRGIRKDTASGIDASGSQFEKYVPAYEALRMRRGLPVKVNLRVKSEDSLLDTLGARRIDEKNSEISVKEDREKIAEGLSKKRHFMGVSTRTVMRIEKKLEDEFARVMQ